VRCGLSIPDLAGGAGLSLSFTVPVPANGACAGRYRTFFGLQQRPETNHKEDQPS
jgi:hypothetical protein